MRRPRFSLLSLLLFTLLGASSVTLYLHFPAWRTERVIPGPFDDLRVSTNGNIVAARIESQNEIRLYRTNGEWLSTIPNTGRFYEPHYFLDDPRYLQVVCRDNRMLLDSGSQEFNIAVWDIQDSRWITEWTFERGEHLHWSLDEKYILAYQYSDDQNDRVRLIESKSGRTLRIWSELSLARPGFLPDGKRMWITTRNYLEIVDLDSARTIMKVPGENVANAALTHIAQEDATLKTIAVYRTGNTSPEFVVEYIKTTLQVEIDNTELMVAQYDNTSLNIDFWNLETRKINRRMDPLELPLNLGYRTAGRMDHYVVCTSGRDPPSSESEITLDVWDGRTGERHGRWMYMAYRNESDFRVVDAQGRHFVLPNHEPVAVMRERCSRLEFIPNTDTLVGIYDENDNRANKGDLVLISRHRPEPWYGLAWLPEFWTTLVLGILFLRNIFRRT
jgi:hypothetical protein